MRLSVKALSGAKVELEVEPDLSVAKLRQLIADSTGQDSTDGFKVVCKGKVTLHHVSGAQRICISKPFALRRRRC